MARKKGLPQGMRKRPNGTIEYRFKIGETRYSVYGSTKEECKEKELLKREEIREEIKEGTYTRGKDLKVSEYFEQWFNSRSGVIASSTLRTYRKLAKRIEKQKIDKAGHTFGDLKLSKIETEHVRQLQRSLLEDGLKTRTANDSISLLRHALEAALNERIIDWNPAKAVERLKRTEEPARDTIHRALTREEEDKFLEAAADSWYYPLYVFLLNTGMRIGEASALAIRDVTKDHINIYKTVTREEVIGYVVREQTKTDAGRRTIDTRPEAWRAWNDQRMYNEALNGGKVVKLDNPVFILPKGGIIRPDRVNCDIKRICKKAGIEPFTSHAFRATSISRCLAAGMEPLLVLETHGQKDHEMLLLYGHGEDDRRREQFLAVNV